MQTGDGLLVRLLPIGTIPLAAFANLCAAARLYGNGVMEITMRGSIQVRGLNTSSAPRFADRVAELGIAADDGVAILTNPLAGIAAEEILDATRVASDLRGKLARRSFTERLSPKVSVAIDGGGPLNLDALAADVRLRAATRRGDRILAVSIGGDAASAMPVGFVSVAHGAGAATRMLDVLAKRGRDARARALVRADGVEEFRSALTDLLIDKCAPPGAPRSRDIIGAHRLLNGSHAYGVGLAFGHADASLLESLVEVAKQSGASGVMPAPGRTIIAVGLRSDGVSSLVADARRLGFIVRPDDPRRRVVACAGAPFCASGHIAARAMAPAVANAAAQFLAGQFTVHISGCAKGCAHPAPARLTLVGTSEGCALVADGTARDTPFTLVPVDRLSAAVADAAREAGNV